MVVKETKNLILQLGFADYIHLPAIRKTTKNVFKTKAKELFIS